MKPATQTVSTSKDLRPVYNDLHAVLLRYVPPYVGKPGASKARPELHIVVPKPVSIPGAYGRTPKQIGLASVILQKSYVGFYYLPLYLDPKIGKQLSPRLMKLLKGKTCFHIKQSNAELGRDIDHALQVGTKYFHDQGWI